MAIRTCFWMMCSSPTCSHSINPTIRSLRTIEDLSQPQQAQKLLSVEKICKSKLSDFNKLADPKRLIPIVDALRGQLNRKQLGKAPETLDLNELLKQTVAVDGTFLHAVSEVAWAVANSNNHGATRYRARLDARIDVSTWLPEAIVIRYKKEGKNSPSLSEAVDQSLSEEDREIGVSSDRVGYFASDSARREGIAKLPLREVIVPYVENGKPKTLRLITNLLDVSAYTIVMLYQHRWQVELFFRWFKSIGHFGHLISHSSEGVLTHLYVTIIATLLMYLHTGYRPSKYMFALLSQVAALQKNLQANRVVVRALRYRRDCMDKNKQLVKPDLSSPNK